MASLPNDDHDVVDVATAIDSLLADHSILEDTTDAKNSSSVETFRQQWRRNQKHPTVSTTTSSTTSPSSIPTTTTNELITPTKSTRTRTRLTVDEKTEKHRMIVRRAYYQKKERTAALRREIETLEAQYQRLVNDTAQLQLVHDQQQDENSTSDAHDDAHCLTCANVRRLRAEYTSLSIAKEALIQERTALEDQLIDYQVFADKLEQSLAKEMNPPSLPSSSTSSTSTPDLLVVETPEFPVSFKPLTTEDCFAVIRSALQDLRSQRTSPAVFHDVGTMPIMGWNRKRTYGERASFSLLKRFPNQSAHALWDSTWRLYTESRLFEQLYSGTVNMKFHVLQRVDDNNVLFCRTLKTEKLAIRNATFFLFSRFHVDGCHYILFRSIDKGRVHADHPEDAVIGMFSWFCFTDNVNATDDTGTSITECEVEFGGTVPSASVADTDFWMMEFVSYLLRLENRAIGPVFNVLQ